MSAVAVAELVSVGYVTGGGGTGAYGEIRIVMQDGTRCFAHQHRDGWMVDRIGVGFCQFPTLVDAGWLTAVNHGPSTFGHTDYVVSPGVVADLVAVPA